MMWPNRPVISARGNHYALGPELTAFFSRSRSRFVGYRCGRQPYGGAFRLSSAQGGVWLGQRRRPAPRLRLGAPNYGDVSPQSAVATIDAGDVGCHAPSP